MSNKICSMIKTLIIKERSMHLMIKGNLPSNWRYFVSDGNNYMIYSDIGGSYHNSYEKSMWAFFCGKDKDGFMKWMWSANDIGNIAKCHPENYRELDSGETTLIIRKRIANSEQ